MANKLKVGMIGLGGIAHTHVPGWASSPYAELVAGSDVNAGVFPAWREKYGVTRFYESAAELINDPEIDIIDICSPNMFHAPQAIAALEAGKHVICEKPLAPTPAEIRQMIAARDRSGKLLMTAQHFRFRGISQAVKAEIDSGVLGDIYHARSWMLRRSGLPVRPTFIYKSQSGGGPCIDIGVHILDLTLWLMGHPRPVAVSGVARAALAHHPGAFSGRWGRSRVPRGYGRGRFRGGICAFRYRRHADDRNELAAAPQCAGRGFARVALRHRRWLRVAGCNIHVQTTIPICSWSTVALMLTQDTMEPHALECV